MTSCPRCDRQLIKNHEELSCLIHGLVSAPIPASLHYVEEPGPQSQRPIAENAGRPWSDDELAYVLQQRHWKAAKDLAVELQRTERAIHHKLSKGGWTKTRVASTSTKKDSSLQRNVNDELEDMARPGGLSDMARTRGLSYNAAWLRLYRRGVRIRTADGLMSIADVMRAYHCSRRRVERLIDLSILKAVRPRRRGAAVRIDPVAAERVAKLLRLKVAAKGGRPQ